MDGEAKVSVATLMASLVGEIVSHINASSIVVLDAFFAVGPVFTFLKACRDSEGKRLVHIVTRAKSNAVGYEDPPPPTGKRGRPPKYGRKRKLMDQFGACADSFEQTTLEIFGQTKQISFLCLDLIWKPIKEQVRFVLVDDDGDHFILMCSDLTLRPELIIKAYSYRFKIEVSFKVLKHLMGAFFYRFWTSVWPDIGKSNHSDLSHIEDPRSQRLIRETTQAIEGFLNMGCIATGILQILSLTFHETIWKNYKGWLRTVSSPIPSEEVVKSVVQEEFFHNFRIFRNTAIHRIIMSKSRKQNDYDIPLAA